MSYNVVIKKLKDLGRQLTFFPDTISGQCLIAYEQAKFIYEQAIVGISRGDPRTYEAYRDREDDMEALCELAKDALRRALQEHETQSSSAPTLQEMKTALLEG